MSGYRLTRIRRNALPDAVNNMLAGAKVGDTLSLTVYGEPSDVVITELDAEWFEGRHTPRPEPARPVAGDTREAGREEIARWLFYKVTRRDGLTKLQWEHLEQPQIDGWLAWADELLAVVAARPALAAQETVDRVAALPDRFRALAASHERSVAHLANGEYRADQLGLAMGYTRAAIALRDALDGDR